MRIEMLGGLRVIIHGRAAPRFRSQKPPALLAYLAYYQDRHHPREVLIEALWPDVDPEAGRNRLNVTLSRIRAHLEAAAAGSSSVVKSDRYHVWLDTNAVETDVAELEEALREDRIEAAVTLYRGELLPGFYEEWVSQEQERLAARMYEVAERSAALEQRQRKEAAAELAALPDRKAPEPRTDEAVPGPPGPLLTSSPPPVILSTGEWPERTEGRALGKDPLFADGPKGRSLQDDVKDNVNRVASGSVFEEKDSATSRLRHSATPRAWLAAAGICILLLGLLAPRLRRDASSPVRAATPTDTQSRNPLWTRQYVPAPDEMDCESNAIATDRAGNLYVAAFVKTKKNDVDILLLKYSPAGQLLWRRRYNGPGNDCDRALFLAIDALGSVYVTGDSYNGEAPKGGTEWDVVTLKYGADGQLRWARRFDDHAEDEIPRGIGLDRDGNAYVAATTKSAGKPHRYVVLKYRPDGYPLWAVRPNPTVAGLTSPSVGIFSFAVAPDGSLFLSGSGEVKDAVGRQSLDMLCFRYDRHGNLLWGHRYPSERLGELFGRAACTDREGNMYVAATHGPPPGQPGARQGEEILVVKYDRNGTEVWSTPLPRAPAKHTALPSGIALDSAGNVFLTASEREPPNHENAVVAELDADGRLLWHDRRGASAFRSPVVGSRGKVYLFGEHSQTGMPVSDQLDVLRYDPEGRLAWRSEQTYPQGHLARAGALHRDAAGNLFTAAQVADPRAPALILQKYAP